jgi:predicted Zn-dependent protease
VLVDYLSTRFNRCAVSTPSSSVTSGTATAPDVQRSPGGIPAALAVHAVAAGPSLATLVRDIRDGFLLREVKWIGTDQQCAGGTIEPNMLLEVRRGHIVRRIMRAHVAFTTKKLWAGLTAVGDASTLRTDVCNDWVGPPPWKPIARVVTAPAVHVREMDIVSRTGG